MIMAAMIVAKNPTLYGFEHSATRLRFVLAVAEAARVRQRGHIVERGVDAFLVSPQLQLAQARRIDEQCAVRQSEQLPMRCCVPPFAVRLSDLGGAHPLSA